VVPTARSPIEMVAASSKIFSHEFPESIVLNIPPDAAPTYMVENELSGTSMSVILPPIFRGPASSQLKLLRDELLCIACASRTAFR